jgi:hypothetical protein
MIRQVWDGLSDHDRKIVLDTPPEPFWVRSRVSAHVVGSLLSVLAGVAYWIGLAVILMVAAKWYAGAAWESHAPPYWVLAGTWWWAKLLWWTAFAAGVLFLILFIGELPEGLTTRARDAIFVKKILGFLWVSVAAIPGFLALLGLLALVTWHGETLVHWAVLAAPWLILVLVVGALLAFALYVFIGRRELTDVVCEMTWDRDHMQQMCRRENQKAQNHFVSISEMRPGIVRRCVLWVVLRVIHWAAIILYSPRGLFNTQSIHFARWTMLDGRRLMFITNYDGSFGGYLGIFATLGATGVSAIWGNTLGFPRTFLLFQDGARDEQRFKARARDTQYETLLWYRRYPGLSMSAIARNAAIRKDLARFSREGVTVPEAELDVFLRRFSVAHP